MQHLVNMLQVVCVLNVFFYCEMKDIVQWVNAEFGQKPQKKDAAPPAEALNLIKFSFRLICFV